MPSLMNKDPMQTHQTLHKFQFSGVELDKLGASGYTIVTIVQDTSTSVTDFKDDMEKTLKQILEACARTKASQGRPGIIIARTVKGKGVSFMEGDFNWHAKPPTDEDCRLALKELENGEMGS